MEKVTVKVNQSSKKSAKQTLLDRMSLLNKDFKYPLKEQEDKDNYRMMLTEPNSAILRIKRRMIPEYKSMVEHFTSHNKLTGNITEDNKFLREFYSLMLEEEDFDVFGHLQLNDKIEEREDCLLSISKGNAKFNHPYFSLPAGYTCPFADICKSFASKDGTDFASSGKKIKDHGDVRCYAASSEVAYPNVRASRWKNFDLLQEFKNDVAGMANLIDKSIRHFGDATLFRIHESGDFYSQQYFDAWLETIRKHPNIKFYAYTKALPYWIARLGNIPENFKLNASKGGTHDELIEKYGLKQAVIVNSPEEAQQLRLPVDVDDSLAYNSDEDFALLLHGVQSKESGMNPQSRENSKLLKQIKNRR